MELPLLIEALKTGGPALLFALLGLWYGKATLAQMKAEFERIHDRLDRIEKNGTNDSLLNLANILGKQMNQTEIAGKIVELVQSRIATHQ